MRKAPRLVLRRAVLARSQGAVASPQERVSGPRSAQAHRQWPAEAADADRRPVRRSFVKPDTADQYVVGRREARLVKSRPIA